MSVSRPPLLKSISFKQQILEMTHQDDKNNEKEGDKTGESLRSCQRKKESKVVTENKGKNKSEKIKQRNEMKSRQLKPASQSISQKHIRRISGYSNHEKMNNNTEVIPEISEELQASCNRIRSPPQKSQSKFLNQPLEQSIQLISSQNSQSSEQDPDAFLKTDRSIDNNLPKFYESIDKEMMRKPERKDERKLNREGQFIQGKKQGVGQQSKMIKINLFGPNNEATSLASIQKNPKKQVQTHKSKKQANTQNALSILLGGIASNNRQAATPDKKPSIAALNNITSLNKCELTPRSPFEKSEISQPQNNQQTIVNILRSIYEMHKASPKLKRSPLKRKKSLMREKYEQKSKVRGSHLQVSNKAGFFDSIQTIRCSQESMNTQEDNLKQWYKLLANNNPALLEVKQKVENQKNLKLKDYLRLVSLSSSQKFQSRKNTQHSLSSKNKTSTSPHKIAINNLGSISLLKLAIKKRFHNQLRNSKGLLYKIFEYDKESNLKFQKEIPNSTQDQINEYFKKFKTSSPIALIQNQYDDLVFACRLHRIYQDDIFVSVKAIKELVENFIERRKRGKKEQELQNQIRQLSNEKTGEYFDIRDKNILQSLLSRFINTSQQPSQKKEALNGERMNSKKMHKLAQTTTRIDMMSKWSSSLRK